LAKTRCVLSETNFYIVAKVLQNNSYSSSSIAMAAPILSSDFDRARTAPGNRLRVAIIGDIHGQWSELDHQILAQLELDLVLFVGDLGNEDVAMAHCIATLDLPKAIILGNHDAWYSASPWGVSNCPYDRAQEDRVQMQIDALGICHVGYGKLDFPALNVSVVGSRPFSWGGREWRNGDFHRQRFGVGSFDESTAKIVAAAHSATCDRLIVIGHNGPTGLGEAPEDICGRDWETLGGDYGDPDLALALSQLRAAGKSVPLVAFGHMHHSLRHTKQRLRQAFCQIDRTLYLNAARCPRIVEQQPQEFWHNFSIVTLQGDQVTSAGLVWADASGQVRQQEAYAIVGSAGTL
jgi:uncharacterized protein (TIGR04168 family)